MNTWELFNSLKKETECFSIEDIAGKIDTAEHPPGSPRYLSGMIASYDLQALIEIRNGDPPETVEEVDTGQLDDFRSRIDSYMDQYAPGQPDLRRYIRAVSTYLAFIAGKPLHPPGMVTAGGQSIVGRGGDYFCPMKRRQLHEHLSLCQYCVSKEIGAMGDDSA